MDDCQFYKVLALAWPNQCGVHLKDLSFLSDLERITPYITHTNHSDLFIVFLDITLNQTLRNNHQGEQDQKRVHHIIKRISVIQRRWQTQLLKQTPLFVAAQTTGEAHALAHSYYNKNALAGRCLFFSPHSLAHLPIDTLPFFYNPISPNLFRQESSWLTLHKRLKRLRIFTVEEFLAITAKTLSSHLGHTSELIWHHIKERKDKPWNLFKSAEKIEASFTIDDWPIGCDSIEPFLFIFKQLLDRCFSRLWCQSAKLRQFRLELKTTDIQNPTRTLTIKLHTLATTSHHVLAITRIKLYHEFEQHPLDGYCSQVSVFFEEIQQYNGRQRNFFSKKDDHIDQIRELQDRIDNKLGQAATYHIQYLDSHWPEHSWCKVFRPTEPHHIQCKDHKIHTSIPFAHRPTRLLQQPLLLESLGLQLWRCPDLNELWTATSITEPEFLYPEWWHPHSTENSLHSTRKYFRMATSQNQSLWIFQNSQNQWYLHGYFD